MEAKRHGMGPGNRLEKGAAILAATRVLDTALIKPRLTAFLAAHRQYVDAQGKVDAADSDVRSAQAKLTQREIQVDDSLEALALALANEGHSRTRPFAAFGAVVPSVVKQLPVREKTTVIHQLVAGIERAKTVSQRARDAARAAEQAVRGLEAALVPIDQLEASRREVRWQRDTVGRKWDTTLAALRRDTRSAADEGAPGLYPALFGAARSTRKRAKAGPAPGPAPLPEPTPAPADSSATTVT